ncbi:hypothetical protein V6N13_006328 [Hibiscus sabdariffa]
MMEGGKKVVDFLIEKRCEDRLHSSFQDDPGGVSWSSGLGVEYAGRLFVRDIGGTFCSMVDCYSSVLVKFSPKSGFVACFAILIDLDAMFLCAKLALKGLSLAKELKVSCLTIC